jgi:hypothetical protein
MQINIWDDREIVQINAPGGRKYAWGDRKFSSVTTILSKFEDKSFLAGWQKRVGAAEAEKIRDNAATHGTKTHNALENHFKCYHDHLLIQDHTRLQGLSVAEQQQTLVELRAKIKLDEEEEQLIRPFECLFPYIKPVALEKKIMWHDDADPRIGFGGTADAYKLVDCRLLPADVKPLFTDGNRSYALVVLDWKNFNKRKRPLEYTRGNRPYFPLIKYALQLSAYSAAFNKLTENKYRLNQGLLACAYVAEVDENGKPIRYELDLFHFDQRSICWFWLQFKKILEAYYNDGSFDWKQFCREAHKSGVLGECLQERLLQTRYDDGEVLDFDQRLLGVG